MSVFVYCTMEITISNSNSAHDKFSNQIFIFQKYLNLIT